jgi:predicted nucleic acid-binding protein
LNFDLIKSLRRLKPSRRTVGLARRPDKDVPFVLEQTLRGPALLLDTCVYIDVLQHHAPGSVRRLMRIRPVNHSSIALAELTHLFGRLDPRDERTDKMLGKILRMITALPLHRSRAPSVRATGEAGILAGLAARLGGIESGREQALLNDAMLYLQAIEQGQVVLTRNIREFDWFDQLLPSGRVLFYRQT